MNLMRDSAKNVAISSTVFYILLLFVKFFLNINLLYILMLFLSYFQTKYGLQLQMVFFQAFTKYHCGIPHSSNLERLFFYHQQLIV